MTLELSTQTPVSKIEAYLENKGWLQPWQHVVRLEKPGEGNMNEVVRVVGSEFSLIFKQSKPYVNKYPTIEAPIGRIGVEHSYYSLIGKIDLLHSLMPAVRSYDPANHLLVLEDLGEGADYTFIYKKGQQMAKEELLEAVKYIKTLHRATFDTTTIRAFPDNLALRQLNHQHLFVFPYQTDHGFDLDTVQQGLQELSMKYKQDETLKGAVRRLGDRYLMPGETLLQGDYYPGSWRKTKNGLRVIDPEFCFFGFAEYDLGVMLAHLRMAQQPEEVIEEVLMAYDESEVSPGLVEQVEGMEILRRIIGLAQLPLDLTLEEKAGLLEMAAEKVKSNS